MQNAPPRTRLLIDAFERRSAHPVLSREGCGVDATVRSLGAFWRGHDVATPRPAHARDRRLGASRVTAEPCDSALIESWTVAQPILVDAGRILGKS